MFDLLKRIGARTTRRIGIFALTPGCGTTHLSISIANYFASKERKSVLYLECRPEDYQSTEGIIRLRTDNTISIAGLSGFKKHGIDYMPSCTPSDVRRLISEKYDIIISEQYCRAEDGQLQFGMYEKCMFLFSAKPWKYNTAQINLKKIIAQKSGMPQGEYCSFGLTKNEEKMIKEEFNLRCVSIPFINDPFRLNNDDLKFLGRLLNSGR